MGSILELSLQRKTKDTCDYGMMFNPEDPWHSQTIPEIFGERRNWNHTKHVCRRRRPGFPGLPRQEWQQWEQNSLKGRDSQTVSSQLSPLPSIPFSMDHLVHRFGA